MYHKIKQYIYIYDGFIYIVNNYVSTGYIYYVVVDRLCNTNYSTKRKKKHLKRQMSVSEATTMTVVGGVVSRDNVPRTNGGSAGTSVAVPTTVVTKYESMEEHAV